MALRHALLLALLLPSAAFAEDPFSRFDFVDEPPPQELSVDGLTIVYQNELAPSGTVVFDVEVPHAGLLQIRIISRPSPAPDTATVVSIPDGFMVSPLTVTIEEGGEALFVITPIILG